MAIIGEIRKRGGLLITIIIGVAIMAFVLGDMLGPGGSLLSSGQSEIAEIAGELISPQEFEQRVQKEIENYKQQTEQSTVDQNTIDQLRQQTWSQLLNEIILGNEYDELGIAVHPKEIWDLVTGPNPHPSIVKAFSNPQTGEFSFTNVSNFLKNMDNDPTGATRAKWIIFELAIKMDRKAEKYNNLIKKGLFATTREAQRDHEAKNKIIKYRYVVQRYNSIPDSIVHVNESEINNYYDEHEKEYEQDASRAIEYVTYDVLPSAKDTLDIVDWITKINEEFSTIGGLASEGIEDNISFVNMNADTRFDDRYLTEGSLSDKIDSIMFNSDTGTVVGPYLEEDIYKSAKLIDVQYRPDSVEARHILMKFTAKDDLVKADSIKKLIEEGSDFAELAKNISEDPGSAVKGGDLGWFAEGTMVKPFNDSCFAAKKGDLLIVESQFGVHLIEVLDQREYVKKIRVGIIDRQIEPSAKTFANIYEKANKFAAENNDKESFDNAVIEQGLITRIADNLKESDKTIIGLESPRELIRWAFRAGKGDISEPFEFGNKFVIAVLTEVKEEGYAPLEQIRTEIEIGAKKEKKAEIIIEKIRANDDKDIEDMAYNLSANEEGLNLTVETVENLTFSSFSIPGVGTEPELIGYIFSMKKGVLSEPLKGKSGVYVVVVDEIVEVPSIEDYSFNQFQLINNMQLRVDYEVFNALQDKANVVDNRHKFY